MKTQSSSIYGVILAGGSGTRFWPRSRQKSPKQLCKITDPKQTMLEQTLHRLDEFIDPERRIIVTHHTQEKKTREISASLCKQILSEPYAKNTAAALALAALQIRIQSSDENAVMISLHSDHLVKNTKAFQESLANAVDLANKGYLALIGIVPRSPDTGFGYIRRGESLSNNAFRVQSFKEKPNLKTAQDYIATQEYYWNSGIFVWQVKAICAEFEKHLPEIWNPLHELFLELKRNRKTFLDLPLKALEKVYAKLPEIAIDNGILEKSSNCAVLSCNFDWNDVGTWTALAEVLPADKLNNIKQGDVLLCETQNSIIASDGPLIATYGVENLIIVVENGCVLVCAKDKAQGIKEIVAKLSETGRNDLI